MKAHGNNILTSTAMELSLNQRFGSHHSELDKKVVISPLIDQQLASLARRVNMVLVRRDENS